MSEVGHEAPTQFSLADEVWHRVVQIVQEAMLMGIDCADLLRQIRVTPVKGSTLELTAEYKIMVNNHYAKLLAEAQARQLETDESKLIG